MTPDSSPYPSTKSDRDTSASEGLAGSSDSHRRGRPTTASARKVCDALLAAAETCLQTKRYANITVREVATAAGVNSAMVNYYFDGKEGLFVALIESLFGEWTKRLRYIELYPCEGNATPTKLFVQAVHHCFYEHRSVLWLLDQELRDTKSVIHAAFTRKLAAQSTSAIARFLKSMGEQGFYRRDLDLRYATYAVSALAMYPSVFAQGLERSYGIQPDELSQPPWQAFLERSLNQLLSPA